MASLKKTSKSLNPQRNEQVLFGDWCDGYEKSEKKSKKNIKKKAPNNAVLDDTQGAAAVIANTTNIGRYGSKNLHQNPHFSIPSKVINHYVYQQHYVDAISVTNTTHDFNQMSLHVDYHNDYSEWKWKAHVQPTEK